MGRGVYRTSRGMRGEERKKVGESREESGQTGKV